MEQQKDKARYRKKVKCIVSRVKNDFCSYYVALIGIGIYYMIANFFFHRFCPFVICTGFPCAGCGLTRALGDVLRGNWESAWRYNPSIFCWIIFGVYFLVGRYGVGKKLRGTTLLLSISCVVTLLFYIYRMVTVFPGEPPMVYWENNMMQLLRNRMLQ